MKNNIIHNSRIAPVTMVWLVVFVLLINITSGLCQSVSNGMKPSDNNATRTTVALYSNLFKLSADHILLGHQDALSYGISWNGDTYRSDIKDVTGSHPAVFGWDVGGIDIGLTKNLDSVPFDKMRENIQAVFRNNGVNTISWHAYSPVNGRDSWTDQSKSDPTVSLILPGGKYHEAFKTNLDRVAEFLKSCKTDSGELIPLIFRPWHENTGNWFWWGHKHCTAGQYKQLYRFTVGYLRETHGLHNLLFAYSPDVQFIDYNGYLERYPGDDVVDIIGLDDYNSLNTGHPEKLISNLEVIARVARDRNKIAAFTETGCNRIERKGYFTQELLPCLNHSELTRSVAWVLFWRNADRKQHFVPDKEHEEAADFIEFTDSRNIMLLNDLPDMYSESRKH